MRVIWRNDRRFVRWSVTVLGLAYSMGAIVARLH
jgi:hypothetical protein